MGIVSGSNVGSLPKKKMEDKGSQQGWARLTAMDGVSSKSLGVLSRGEEVWEVRCGTTSSFLT